MYANMNGNNKPSSLEKLADKTDNVIKSLKKVQKLQKAKNDAEPKRTMFSGSVVRGKPTRIKNQNLNANQFDK